jgi:hypothetical protein
MSTEAVPDPALFAVVFDPYDVDVPYSTSQVVAWPPGSTAPVTVAEVDPTAVVGPVVALGAEASALPVSTESASTAAPAAGSHLHLFAVVPIACPLSVPGADDVSLSWAFCERGVRGR